MGLTRIRAEQISDIDYKQATRVVSTTNVTLTGSAPNTVDGVTLLAKDRILVQGQSTGSQNGIYEVQILGTGSNGTWIRTNDSNANGEIQAGMVIMVTEGSIYKDTLWKLTTNNPITIDTTDLVFELNTAFGFANLYANGTAVIATAQNDTLTISAGNNLSIIGNAVSKTITFEVVGISLNSISNGTSNVNVVSSGGNVTVGVSGTNNVTVFGQNSTTFAGNVLPAANITYNLGSETQRWNDIWLSNSTIYLGNAQISANATAISITNPAGGTTVLSGITPTVSADAVTATGNITGGNLVTSGVLSVTGNANLGNIGATNAVLAGALSGVTTIDASGNANLGNIGASNAVFTNIAGTLTTAAQTNITSVGTLGSLAVTGNVTSGNVSGTRGAFTNVAGTLETAAQPNITSVGTLTSLSVTGNITGGNLSTAGQITTTGNITGGNLLINNNAVITGNLTVNGTETIFNVNTLSVNDKDIIVANNVTGGANVDGAGLQAGNPAVATWFFNNATTSWQSNVGITPLANATLSLGGASNYWGTAFLTAAAVTGNVSAGNVSGTNLTGTLETVSQPNITSVGTLTSLSVTGNITGGNLLTSGNIFDTSGTLSISTVSNGNINLAPNGTNTLVATTTGANISGTLNATGNANVANIGATNAVFTNISGTLTTAAQPNITSVGTLSSLSVTGNANVGNIGATNAVLAGALSGVTTISASGNANVGNLGTAGLVVATGNITGGNLTTSGRVDAQGNISANYYTGNGSALDGIESFKSITITSGNTIVANSTAATLTLTAGEGIALVANAATDTITIATQAEGSAIFVDGADFGTVNEVVTTSDDLGLVTELVDSEADLGEVVTAGVFYPSQLVLPTYTVSTLPSASPAAQFVYVSDETGGAVPAFSDGTNWRRVTDRAIVT